MTFTRQPRFDLDRLLAFVRPALDGTDANHDRQPLRVLADLLGVPAKSVYRWREHGIPLDFADRAALALGLHACLIWPEWLDIKEEGIAA